MNMRHVNPRIKTGKQVKAKPGKKVSLKLVTLTILLIATLVAAGCAPQATVAPTATRKPATAIPSPTKTLAPTMTATPTETPSLQVSSLNDVRQATVQILTQGTFMDPKLESQQVFAGKGTGFIIDKSGIALTNNHVVTGAAILKVKLPDEEETRNARVVGVSECSDLAVIDIEGDGFSYLGWFEDPIQVGMAVYAAGFPLGDPEYTLTQGIISKEHANGEVPWASIAYVIEHDANLNPGNSGGPLVTQNGEVVGVNYASYEAADQSFAISRDEALSVLEVLVSGKDVDSIGVNGLAVSYVEELAGIWVFSVRSGSQADDSGIQPGDLITKMEGMELAKDGTMSAYCDILRSHEPSDTLTVEVARLSDHKLLKGQINGRTLEVISEIHDRSSTVEGGYITVTDDYEMIEIDVPASWNDIDGSPWVGEGEIFGASIVASPDLEGYYDTWRTPGVWFAASSKLASLGGFVQVLDWMGEYYRENCEYEGRDNYDDGVYRGKFDVFSNCGGEGGWVIQISAVPKDDPTAYMILVDIYLTSEADWEFVEHSMNSFMVIGDLSQLAYVNTGK